MCTHKAWRRNGFVLIEALIALLLISVGLLAVSRLQVLSLSGAGEAKSYSAAMALSQQKMEELRNILLRTQFGIANGTATAGGGAGDNASYTMTWTVLPNPIVATTEQVSISLRTTWVDRYNQTKTLDLNSLIAWDDPGARVASTPPGGLPQLVSPTGEAKRGSGADSPNFPGAAVNPDRSRIHVRSSDQVTELLSSTGKILLELPPNKLGVAQSFTTITGKVFFDRGVNQGKIPLSTNVRLRLSSEGECIFDSAALLPASVGTNDYFIYTCYVGTGWYGNVGVVVNQSPLDPTICVGDPNFNAGVSNGTLISAHPQEAATRSYRGFKDGAVSGTYLSTGVAAGRKYGLSYGLSGSTVVPLAGPFDGRPLPSAYTFPGYSATVTADPTLNYFEQNFLVTYLGGGGGASCNARMTGGVFTRNAGEYFCINLDNDNAATDRCPAIWPNFESQVGTGGGSINFTLTVSVTGSGIVGSDITGINCGTSCSASYPTGTSVTLTATPATGATFTSWSGCTSSSSNTCTVAMSAAAAVTANFTAAPTYTLTVAKSGGGAGTVDSGDGIACGLTCTASYVQGYQVTLTATAPSGSTFTGWSGCLTMSGNTCNVTMSAATTVTAAFDITPTFTLTAAKVGSGTITSDVGGISCGTNCSASYVPGTTVTLTATAASGYAFGSWSGCTGASTNVCTVVMGSSAGTATATFNLLPSHLLTAAKAGAGAGTIVSTSPDAAINCGSACSASYLSATTVTLTATAAGGSTFGSWSGCTSVSGATCTVSMTAAKTVTATFTLNASCTTTFKGKAHALGDTVTASSGGVCTTSSSGAATYQCPLVTPSGTVITLTDVSGSQTYTLGGLIATCGNQNNVNFP